MREIVEQVLVYLRGVWRYRWFALVVAWLICVAGWTFVTKLPDNYESSARVQVDTQTMLRPVLRGLAFDVDAKSKIELVTRTLLSRPNVERIARKSDLDLEAQDGKAFEGLISRLQRSIRLQGGRREDIYGIKYMDKDPQLARDVVQATLDIFMENALGETKGGTYSAKRFLDTQIQEYEQRLLDSEKELKEFKRTNLGLMPSDRGDYYQRMQREEAELDTANLELRQAERRRDSLRRQIGGEEPTFGLGGFASPQLSASVGASFPGVLPIAASLELRTQNMEEALDELLLRYTERHPEVVAARETLARLTLQRDRERNAQPRSLTEEDTPQGPIETNPIYQHLKIALGQEELNIVALQVRVAEFEQRYEELKSYVDAVPDVEARMASLNRDYEVTRSNYQELVARRESVRLSQKADETNEDFQFRIVEPPRVPNRPSGPNRVLMYSGVMVFGIGAGIAIAFLMSQMWTTFDTARRVVQVTGLPILGSVGMVLSTAARRRARLGAATYLALGALLLSLYSGLMLQATRGVSILSLI